MFERKSILAKLLAKENIEVVRKGDRTASFDVKNRRLYLPVWKEMSNDLIDLLEGHEVGHALFTPVEGWHESVVDLGIPRSLVNIIEDIRIEKKIIQQYPGLLRNFIKGYQELLDKNFFGLEERPINTLGFMSRLNVYSKSRNLVEVPFLDEELYYLNRAMSVETFDDVIEVCKEIVEWLKEDHNDNKNPEQEVSDDAKEQTDGENDDLQSGTLPQDSDDTEDQDGEDFSENPGDDSESTEEDSKEESRGEQSKLNKFDEGSSEEEEPYTEKTFRENEGSLTEAEENNFAVSQGFEVSNPTDYIIGYEEVIEARNSVLLKELERDNHYVKRMVERFYLEYNDFIKDSEKTVSSMAREFERRKAAYQHKRAKTSKSGTLDLNKLHNYKFSEDIFLSNRVLADAKSHGMVAIIDFSGSMGNVIKNVVEQAITLAMFCRKVNIPFDIYSFTSGDAGVQKCHKVNRTNLNEDQDYNLSANELQLIHQLSSSMDKKTFKEATRSLYFAFAHNSNGWSGYNPLYTQYDSLGGTPLDSTLMVMHDVLDKFKKKHNLQKVNLVAITDGETQYMRINNTYSYYNRKRIEYIKVQKKYLKIENQYNITQKLIENLKKKGYNTISYFIVERPRDINYLIRDEVNQKDIMKKFRTNKVVNIGEFKGYDSYFFIDGRQSTVTDEFEVKENAKKGDIARAFKKYAKSQRSNKVLATEFAKAVS